MSYRLVFFANAIVAFVFGLAFLLAPALMLGYFGTETYASTLLIGRFFGTAMISLGLLLWFAKDVTDAGLQRGMGIALFISAILGLVVNVIGISPASGVIRSYGWLTITIYVLFALGYGYLIFLMPRMKE